MKKLATLFSIILLFASVGFGNVYSQRPENPGKPDSNPSSERSNRPDDDDVNEEGDDQKDENERGRSSFAHIKSNQNKLQVTFEGVDDEGEATEEGDIEDEFDVEDDEDGLKVKAHDNASLVIRNKLAAQTNFPLKINLDTNELIVTTPKGEKSVTVLPDAAVFNMLAANVLDQLGGKGGLQWLADQVTPTATPSGTVTPSATPSGTITPTIIETPGPTSTPSGDVTVTPEASPTETELLADGEESPIKLVLDEDGNLVYEIKGIKVQKFLGIFEVDVDRVVIVSAETGELIEVNHNLANRILDLLSVDQ